MVFCRSIQSDQTKAGKANEPFINSLFLPFVSAYFQTLLSPCHYDPLDRLSQNPYRLSGELAWPPLFPSFNQGMVLTVKLIDLEEAKPSAYASCSEER